MALRDQPYLPLYIQDIMTDEKLNECSAATHGIYIKGIMCLMHKSETYGKLLLKQKHKQNQSMCLNFANMLSLHLPYSTDEILKAVTELIEEKVCFFEGDYLIQKRMVNDNLVSEARSAAGKIGGKNSAESKRYFAEANSQANTEYEYSTTNSISEEGMGETLWTAIVKNFYNDFRWREKFCRDKNIKLPELDLKQKEFISDLELKEDFKELTELKRHFTNWFNLNKNGKSNTSARNGQAVARERLHAKGEAAFNASRAGRTDDN